MVRFHRVVSSAIVLALCGAAFWLLFRQLQHVRLDDIRLSLTHIPASRLCASVGLTVASYLLLIAYDWLAVRTTGRSLSLRRTALASFVGFVTGYNFGSLLGGGSARYRLYSGWGFSSFEILQIVAMIAVTYFVGIFTLAGVVFSLMPLPLPESFELPFLSTRPLGVALLIMSSVYVCGSAWRRPVRFGNKKIMLPSLPTTLTQIGIAMTDAFLLTSCLYVLADGAVSVSFIRFLSAVLLAMVVTVLTHVPGGLGVFELVIVTVCGEGASPELVAALLVFRLVYFLLPLLIAAVLLMGREFLEHHSRFRLNRQTISAVGPASGGDSRPASVDGVPIEDCSCRST
jgi:uncharacterized membrane protein YbhN (UPF0104 family)